MQKCTACIMVAELSQMTWTSKPLISSWSVR